MSQEFGPEFSLLGRGRHLAALRAICSHLFEGLQDDVSDIVLFFTVDGRFAPNLFPKPITDGVRRCSMHKDGHLYVDIGLSLATIELDEQAFRRRVVRLISEASARILVYVSKKRLDFDSLMLAETFSALIAEYEALQLPLPISSSEIETARALEILDRKPPAERSN